MSKRLFDVFFALTGLLLLSPLLLATAVLIRLGSLGPIFYRGMRVGLNGRLFRVFKFRTMVVHAEKLGGATTSADDPRVTPVGAFLRKYKLDELPQFLNVLTGDMSFVGPRPPVPSEAAEYDANARRLLTIRPGITDYASIRFRNEGDIVKGYPDPHKAYEELILPEKIRLGLRYVDHHNLWIDIRIILATLRAVAFE